MKLYEQCRDRGSNKCPFSKLARPYRYSDKDQKRSNFDTSKTLSIASASPIINQSHNIEPVGSNLTCMLLELLFLRLIHQEDVSYFKETSSVVEFIHPHTHTYISEGSTTPHSITPYMVNKDIYGSDYRHFRLVPQETH